MAIIGDKNVVLELLEPDEHLAMAVTGPLLVIVTFHATKHIFCVTVNLLNDALHALILFIESVCGMLFAFLVL